ncbi:polymorphic toxin type 17 domain-containing protein, partial [Streptomyces sp. NPDC002742]|uniref:polymorphic toxin type 17 domain-containing protein n=1 Tax=Streptomyces sp. NPDC002742 TaxID=3364663 RepID=UPI003674B2C6
TYSYDAADRLTQTSAGSSATGYDYDADGNQIKAGSTTFGYDAENRLTGVTTSSTQYGFTYDADGLRTKATKSGTALRTTTWDLNYDDGLPRVATETNGSGSLIADNQYNPLDQIQGETTGSGPFYHHHDLLGSVTDITDSAGAAQTAYDYTAFGELTTTNIAAAPPVNRFTFTGEYKEPTTSTAGYYLRARNYDPGTGRFTTRDPHVPAQDTPYTQAYAYAENMPTTRTDPSGLCSVTTQLKDAFTGNWGWNNNCAKEDRETAAKPPAVQAAKNLSDTTTRGLINVSGQGSLGLIDGITFGTFSYFSGAQITCPQAYNFGLYASMVPFPIEGGGKRLAAEGAEVLGRDVVQTGMKGLIKKAQLPFRGRIRYVPPSGTSVSAGLPRAPRGGFIDKFGNTWVKGPSRTPGEPFEWDVQLSRQGKAQLGWASRDGSHLNVSLNGRITHK